MQMTKRQLLNLLALREITHLIMLTYRAHQPLADADMSSNITNRVCRAHHDYIATAQDIACEILLDANGNDEYLDVIKRYKRTALFSEGLTILDKILENYND